MKLIDMTTFVLEQAMKATRDYNMTIESIAEGNFAVASEMALHADCFLKCKRYARFLSMPIKMEMFVPAEQLSEMPGEKIQPGRPLFPELENKVLFKDLEIKFVELSKKFTVLKKNGFFVISGQRAMFDGNVTIESLVHRELELTDTAVKLIFGQ